MLAVALVIFLNMTSCSTYDEGPAFSLRTKKARLTNGEWEWADGKENIKIDYDEGDDTEFHVTRLTNSEFWFEDEDNIEYECEKD